MVSRWAVIVPVESLTRAKPRLDQDYVERSALLAAMAEDVLDAIRQSSAVDVVIVVGGDRVGEESDIWISTRHSSLNEAVAAGESSARERGYDHIAVMVSDIASVTTMDIDDVLRQANQFARSFVSDYARRGVTVLASTGTALAPDFGGASAERYRSTGAVEITAHARIRIDVDSFSDLALSLVHEWGPRTTRMMSRAPGHLLG